MIKDKHTILPQIIVPVSIELDWPSVEETVESIIEQNEKFGIKSFMLEAPSGAWRSIGFPSISHFETAAKTFVEVKQRLADRGLTIGWWNMLTIKSGTRDDFTPIMTNQGNPHPFATCPLCEAFQDAFAGGVAACPYSTVSTFNTVLS